MTVLNKKPQIPWILRLTLDLLKSNASISLPGEPLIPVIKAERFHFSIPTNRLARPPLGSFAIVVPSLSIVKENLRISYIQLRNVPQNDRSVRQMGRIEMGEINEHTYRNR